MGKGFVPNTEKRNVVPPSWFQSSSLSVLPLGAHFTEHLRNVVTGLQITVNSSTT